MRKKTEYTPLIFDTYISMIKNSVGSKLFRNFYTKVNGKKTNIVRKGNKGNLSCALYVSSILTLFKSVKEMHATVDSTVKDMQRSGWKVIKKPKIGSVLVWEKVDFGNNDIRKHIGFYIGRNRAISNNHKLGYPVIHSWNFGAKRKVDLILWYPNLEVKYLNIIGGKTSNSVIS